MNKLMVSVSGVRGIVGDGLSPAVVLKFAQSFGVFAKGGQVALAGDSRVSGPMVKSAVVSGLLSVGCDILDLGVCPTPTIQLAVENHGACGGIMITASHNPIMWNGLKLIDADGMFLDAEQGKKLLDIYDRGDFPLVEWDGLGTIETFSKAIPEHLETILNLEYIDKTQIKSKRFKVVLDCIFGAGSNLVPQLLHEFGCEVITLNCEPTGLFSRNPEPLPENLGELSAAVREHGADIGIAIDPDSDRLALVSEKGQPLGEERTLALAVKFMLSKKLGKVVINASTSRATQDIAENAGASVTRTKVGEIHVAKKMREIGAVIGGEGNGGVILPDVHLGRDAPIGIALVLQLLSEFGGTVSQLNDGLPRYVITKDKVELRNIDPDEALVTVRNRYATETLDFTDGVKIDRADSWVHVRASNTEPIVRIIAEAPTQKESRRLCAEVKNLLNGLS